MPFIIRNCICRKKLAIYVPPSMQFESSVQHTTQCLAWKDSLEDADREIEEAIQNFNNRPMRFLDARVSSLCPACSRQLRFTHSPEILIRSPTGELPISNMFWETVLQLAMAYGWRPPGSRGIFGIQDVLRSRATNLYGNGQTIRKEEAREIAAAVEQALPDISVQEMQKDDGNFLESLLHPLSGRFRPQVVKLIGLLRGGQITIGPDVEAVVVTSAKDLSFQRQTSLKFLEKPSRGEDGCDGEGRSTGIRWTRDQKRKPKES